MLNTEICAFIPPKLKTLYQLGYYIYSFCKSIQDLRKQPLNLFKFLKKALT